jgi:putative CocE/NonD family hydrolase
MTSVLGHAYEDAAYELALDIFGGLIKEVGLPKFVWYITGTGEPNDPGSYLAGANEWPTPKNTTFYLQDLKLNTTGIFNSTTESSSFIYNPENPFPTLGGAGFSPATFKTMGVNISLPACGHWDQMLLGERNDVLRFTAPPFANATYTLGWSTATLFVSSNCTDTDFSVQVVDVFPNGTRLLVQEGVVRMRWRNADSAVPQLLTPGMVYRIDVDLWAGSWVFPQGHSVGLDISSSNSPRYTVNPNNGLPLSQSGPMLTALNTVEHSAEYASSFTLPVVQQSQLPHWWPKSPAEVARSVATHRKAALALLAEAK